MEVLYSINQTRYHMEITGEADGTNGRFSATHIKSNAKISLPFSLSAVEEWSYAKKDSLIIFGDIVATFLDLYLLLAQEGKDDPGNTNRIIYKINVAAREAVIPPSRSHRGSLLSSAIRAQDFIASRGRRERVDNGSFDVRDSVEWLKVAAFDYIVSARTVKEDVLVRWVESQRISTSTDVIDLFFLQGSYFMFQTQEGMNFLEFIWHHQDSKMSEFDKDKREPFVFPVFTEFSPFSLARIGQTHRMWKTFHDRPEFDGLYDDLLGSEFFNAVSWSYPRVGRDDMAKLISILKDHHPTMANTQVSRAMLKAKIGSRASIFKDDNMPSEAFSTLVFYIVTVLGIDKGSETLALIKTGAPNLITPSGFVKLAERGGFDSDYPVKWQALIFYGDSLDNDTEPIKEG